MKPTFATASLTLAFEVDAAVEPPAGDMPLASGGDCEAEDCRGGEALEYRLMPEGEDLAYVLASGDLPPGASRSTTGIAGCRAR